jgi:hypothetical protein
MVGVAVHGQLARDDDGVHLRIVEVVKAPADFISIEIAVAHHVKEVSHHVSPRFLGRIGCGRSD